MNSCSESQRLRQESPVRSFASKITNDRCPLGKVVADGQASLAAADDDGLDLLGHATKRRRISVGPASLKSLIFVAREWSNLTISDGSDEAVFESEGRGRGP